MAFTQTTQIPLHYEVFDGLVDQDTVCLHGNLASNAWWIPAIEAWKRKGSQGKTGRLICAEWRGCGGSKGLQSEKDLSLPALGADYNQLLRELKISKAQFIGHSTGGLIALFAVLQAPELWTQGVLLDSVGPTGVQFSPEIYAAFTQMSQDRAVCEAVMMGTIYNTNLDPGLQRQIVNDAFGVDKAIWHGVPNMLRPVDIPTRLAEISQPLLVLHGEFDLLLKKEDSLALAKGIPGAEYSEIPGRGHSCNVEDGELFTRLVDDFFSAKK